MSQVRRSRSPWPSSTASSSTPSAASAPASGPRSTGATGLGEATSRRTTSSSSSPSPRHSSRSCRDPEPDPDLGRLEAENRRLQDEIERLRGEFTKLKLVETPEPAYSHLLFVPTPARYLLVEREGAPPEPGSRLELDEGAFAVAKLGDAPFPGEPRPCAFLLPLAYRGFDETLTSPRAALSSRIRRERFGLVCRGEI